MVHVFLVGSKGIPAKYGGFETFIENLTLRKKNKDIYYHVSCMNNDEKHFTYNGADCFNVKLPIKGAIGRILHVSRVLNQVEKWKEENKKEEVIVYILGCRIGPLLISHAKKMHAQGIKLMVNPDGLEWKRDKWSKPEKIFLKYCEKCLVMNADLVVCDSQNIEKYILQTYPSLSGKTTYIAYGADIAPSACPEQEIEEWLCQHKLEKNEYYLIVGRFVPENNYEVMISEYIKSSTRKPLVIISNVENNKFYRRLKERTHFEKDERIRFVGTVYNTELLKKIRECAFAYIHGHEVGGTNPSLLEALASTKLNLLLNVGFNREVAEDEALYWEKSKGKLAQLINSLEWLPKNKIKFSARKRVDKNYSWDKICNLYENVFQKA